MTAFSFLPSPFNHSPPGYRYEDEDEDEDEDEGYNQGMGLEHALQSIEKKRERKNYINFPFSKAKEPAGRTDVFGTIGGGIRRELHRNAEARRKEGPGTFPYVYLYTSRDPHETDASSSEGRAWGVGRVAHVREVENLGPFCRHSGIARVYFHFHFYFHSPSSTEYN